MTFIATFVGESFAGISDVIVSTPTAHGIEQVKFFPLHNFGPENSASTTVSFAQKSVIIDPQTLILLSGQADKCRKFLGFLVDDLKINANFDFIRTCKDFDAAVERMEEEHFIFHKISFYNKERNITGCHSMTWNVFHVEEGDHNSFFGGSGVNDLALLNIDRNREGFDARVTPWLSRLLMALGQELLDGDPISKGYGGWYELITAENGQFQKLPYTVVCWRALDNGEVVLVGPIAGSEYQGHNLGIGRINFDGDGVQSAYTWVGDPLERDTPKSISPSILTIFNTPIHIHLIFDGKDKISTHTVYKSQELNDITVSYADGSLRISYSQELYQHIRAATHKTDDPITKFSEDETAET